MISVLLWPLLLVFWVTPSTLRKSPRPSLTLHPAATLPTPSRWESRSSRPRSRPPSTAVTSNNIRIDPLWYQRVRQTPHSVIWIDLENVRGKTGFSMTHPQIMEDITQWANYHQLPAIIVVDHGTISRAYWIKKESEETQQQKQNQNQQQGVAVVFSGNMFSKADDVVAKFVGTMPGGYSVIVTADNDLQTRCRRACQQPNSYQIIDPSKFLQELEATRLLVLQKRMQQVEQEQATKQSDDETIPLSLSIEDQVQMGRLDDEIRLRAQIMDVQVQLGKSQSRTNNKRRKKLSSKLDRLQNQLVKQGPSLLHQVTSLESDSLLLQRWKQIQQSRKEQTGDRVVLAEQLRRQLEESANCSDFTPEDLEQSAAKSFVQQFNLRYGTEQSKHIQQSTQSITSLTTTITLKKDPLPIPSSTPTQELLDDDSRNPLFSNDQISIVAISDTHGFEAQLLTDNDNDDEPGAATEILPPGDVLLHLGDFTGDNGSEGWNALDEWLSKQPHPIKIVVRGNHDPWEYPFQVSGAWYITDPITFSITKSISMGVIPFGSSRKLTASQSLPTNCDILATHVPPLHTLDRTLTGKAAGSGFLNRVVSSMGTGAPRLWFCGHIHEARGVAHRSFGGKQSTMVINAANANRGRAMQLDHGAAVVRIHQKDNDRPIEILRMEIKSISKKLESNDTFFQPKQGTQESLLMAIDLGLKSGIALFGSNGKLLRYEQFHFERESLDRTAKRLLTEWEKEAQLDNHDSLRVTHIAMEGADSYMLHAWTDAAKDVSILRVSPEEWRAELLLEKERLSASNAKAASRLIARQVVEDFGIMPRHVGKFPTDVAEAVCLGFYVSYKLGWLNREGGTVVRRYTNGSIVVPK